MSSSRHSKNCTALRDTRFDARDECALQIVFTVKHVYESIGCLQRDAAPLKVNGVLLRGSFDPFPLGRSVSARRSPGRTLRRPERSTYSKRWPTSTP